MLPKSLIGKFLIFNGKPCAASYKFCSDRNSFSAPSAPKTIVLTFFAAWY